MLPVLECQSSMPLPVPDHSNARCQTRLQDEEIKSYIDTLEPLDCAGGFALEGKGGKYIEKIDGCFSNVMGLSLPWLRKSLIKQGIFP